MFFTPDKPKLAPTKPADTSPAALTKAKTGELHQDDRVVFCHANKDCASAEQVMNQHRLSCPPMVDRKMRIIGMFACAVIQAKARAATASSERNSGS